MSAANRQANEKYQDSRTASLGSPVNGISPNPSVEARKKDEDSVGVVIPAYNEATVLGDVVRQIRAIYPKVVIVDDGSTDDTSRIAHDAGAILLCHPINLGRGAALQTGITYALR